MSQILEDKLEKMSPEEQNLWALRHTAEHILHTATQNIYKDKLKKAMGPATKEGFYFDFDVEEKINEEDFPKIEKEMQKLVDLDLPMVQEYISEEEARQRFKDNPYKIEWIDEIAKRGEKISVYKMGDMDMDLCSGPHIKSTGEVKAFKLLSIAGAYWHGDEKNKMLTRVYGTAFASKEDLNQYLYQLEEAKKRDHRKLGQEMDLYSVSQLTGPGLILWHPKLAMARNIVEQYWKDVHYQNGYQLVFTPHIASIDMFVKSRHYNKYINSMFPAMLHQFIEGESALDYSTDEQLKPMNCPNHIQIFKAWPKSYKDLPMKIGELGTVYRYERAGTLHGMTRVRGFTQDDSHIFCRPDQAIEEIRGVLKLTQQLYKVFGFKDYQAYVATMPEKHLGDAKTWMFAENALKKALDAEGIGYRIDEGEGAFYGPKIDSKVKDSIGREWTLGTIQFDFNMPEKAETTEEDIDEFWAMKTFKEKYKTRENLAKYLKKQGRGFDVHYINEKGEREQAVMIHRTVLGSMERFFGILIEHFAGAFPLWISPLQVKVLPISEKSLDYAKNISKEMVEKGIRVEVDERGETLGAKIRDAQNQKVPYMIIVGEKEKEAGKISVRTRSGQDLGQRDLSDFISQIKDQIEKKNLD